jgi:hypothetical protein
MKSVAAPHRKRCGWLITQPGKKVELQAAMARGGDEVDHGGASVITNRLGAGRALRLDRGKPDSTLVHWISFLRTGWGEGG